MPRSDEAQAFYAAVYAAIQEIPRGRVTSYAHIAKLIGMPQRPRQVGMSLKHLPSPTSPHDDETTPPPPPHFHSGNVPWQRVINSKGVISPRNHPSGARNQAAALRQEGVTVRTGALGELMVDFGEYGWFPQYLPSEGLRDEDADEDDEDDEDE